MHNNSRKVNYEHIFNNLEEYMFSAENMIKYTSNKVKKDIVESKKYRKTAAEPAEVSYVPHHKDKLFWSFYILLHGFDKYEFVKNDNFKVEKMFKIATVEKLRGMKDLLKEAKLRRSEIEDELVNQQKITAKGLHALCMVYGVSVTYVFSRKYCQFLCGDTAQGVILRSDKGDDGIKYEYDEAYMTHVRNNYWEIADPSAPMKAFSLCALKELQEICSRLEISLSDASGKKKSKKSLYEDILNKL
jgi:hypothetical protein